MSRKLFCEISPLTYNISTEKERVKRRVHNLASPTKFAQTKSLDLLPVLLQKHRSLIRRKLGNANMQLQDNKAKNLQIAAPKISNILILPGETFSFWKLVGNPSAHRGYLEGVTISSGHAATGIGGGLCQFTNLIHWMVLHTDLEIVEHHHHDNMDLFPDFKRQIPFGTGTSIVYNYLDYRFKNTTDKIYQLIITVTDEYLCGEIRSDKPLAIKIHIREEESYFYEQNGKMFRHNKIYRKVVDKRTGNMLENKLLLENNALVMYDKSYIDSAEIKR